MENIQKEKDYSGFNVFKSANLDQIRYLIVNLIVKISLLSVICCAFTYRSNAQPGSLDPSFGENGEIYYTLFGDNYMNDTQIQSCVVLPDGKILVAGYYQVHGVNFYRKLFILKFNQDGSADNAFGLSGKIEMSVPGYVLSQLQDMIIQPDGKILLAVNLFPSNPYHAYVIRLYSNGLIDDTFGNNGYLYSDGYTTFSRIAFQSDGKIIVCGTDYSNQGMARHSLYRYNADWSIDTAFGDNGIFRGWFGQANSVKIQPDGKILIGGYVMYGVKSVARITRANANGELDLEFGSDGFYDLYQTLDCAINKVELQSDNKILISMTAYTSDFSQSIVSRLNINGSIDTSFGDEGSIITCSDHCNGFGFNVLPNGQIVVLEGTGICRLNNDGTIENTFGQAGHFIFGEAYGYPKVCNVMDVQSDSKIVSAGVLYDQQNDFHYVVYIARMLNGALGIQSYEDNKFDVYPIPCSDKIYLKNLIHTNAISQISIINLQGQVILSICPASQYAEEIDLNQFNPGQYFVGIMLENGVMVSKHIIKK